VAVLLILLWLPLSLVLIATPCIITGVLSWIFPCKLLKKSTWWLYLIWGGQLAWLVRYSLPKLYCQKIIFPKNRPFVVVANHYCWLDILVLFAGVFSKEHGFVFVMKRSLRWMPIIGLSCVVLNFPLIDRKRSGRRNKKVLESYALKAHEDGYGIVIFPEGTRYVKSNDNSEYQNLLRPKWMGLEKIVKSMGDEVLVLDATIAYEDSNPSVWRFLCKKVGKVSLAVELTSVRNEDVKSWLLDRWARKDLELARVKSQFSDIG